MTLSSGSTTVLNTASSPDPNAHHRFLGSAMLPFPPRCSESSHQPTRYLACMALLSLFLLNDSIAVAIGRPVGHLIPYPAFEQFTAFCVTSISLGGRVIWIGVVGEGPPLFEKNGIFASRHWSRIPMTQEESMGAPQGQTHHQRLPNRFRPSPNLTMDRGAVRGRQTCILPSWP